MTLKCLLFVLGLALLVNLCGAESDAQPEKLESVMQELRTSPRADQAKLVPHLIDVLTACPPDTAVRAASAFRDEFADNQAIASALAVYLRDGKKDKKAVAAQILLAMSFQGTFSIRSADAQIVAKALETDPDPKVREAMAQILPRTGAQKLAVVKQALLHGLAGDEDARVRLLCAMSLGDVGREEYFANNDSTVRALTEALTADTNHRVRAHAAYALGVMREKAGASIKALCSALKDDSSEVRSSALDAVGKLGPAAEPAVPILIEILEGPSENLPRGSAKVQAAQALRGIGPRAAPAVKALSALLADRTAAVAAASALERIGHKALPALPDLIAALNSSDNYLREAAAKCLGGFGSDARKAIPALEKAAEDNRTVNGTGNAQSAKKAAVTAIRVIETEKR